MLKHFALHILITKALLILILEVKVYFNYKYTLTRINRDKEKLFPIISNKLLSAISLYGVLYS